MPGKALQYAHPEMKSRKDVVLAAVARDGNAMKFVSLDLANDPELLKAAQEVEGGFIHTCLSGICMW